ncbi:MAG TPA: TIGR01777 family oxidoreductase [Terriglobales bacterium]|nr:TIGR01777 family oxidoreductase [Terriglobales bacterium]
MKVAVTGASGLIGSALVTHLRQQGHEVFRFVRRPAGAADERPWNPSAPPDSATFDGMEGVVHLAGRNIAAARWSAAQKEEILASRVGGTRSLAESFALNGRKPAVLVTASAIGIYGDRGDEMLTESSAPGTGFLADVVQQWEQATQAAARAGVRTVCLRFGVVLSAHGGALPRMLPPFRAGLGGRVGSGRQWMSWIDLHDAVSLIAFALQNPQLHGPVNAVAPNPVRNSEFTRALGEQLHRPTLFPLPAAVVKVLLGEMGRELLLASQRVQPVVAQAAGFRFTYPELRGALQHVLAPTAAQPSTARTSAP